MGHPDLFNPEVLRDRYSRLLYLPDFCYFDTAANRSDFSRAWKR